MPLLLASQGAKFMAKINKVDKRIRASFEVTLNTGGKVETEQNVQMFDTEDEAEAWLQEEAKVRGFN